jgi:hypothetical protein
MQELRVDSAGLQAMATRWDSAVGELHATADSGGAGLACQASAAAVSAAHADVSAFTAALAERLGGHATHVAEADAHYLANEAESSNELAAVAPSVISI